MRYLKKFIALILGVCALMFLPSISLAQGNGKLTGIAFGLSLGRVEILHLPDLSVQTFVTTLARGISTLGLKYFPDAKKLVFYTYADYEPEIGIIHFPTEDVRYWQPEDIGLGNYLISATLSLTSPNIVYGRFSPEPSREFKTREEFEEFQKMTRIGAFDVLTGTWKEVSHASKSDMKSFSARLDRRPEWKEKYKPVWETLRTQHLLPDEARSRDLLEVDEHYVLFRTEKELVLCRREHDEITVEKRILVSDIPSEGNFLYAQSVAFIYAENEYILTSAQEEAMTPIPCHLYRTERKDPSLSLLTEISPQQGIRRVEAYPHQRKIALWRYEEDETGSLVLVNVDMPDDLRTIPLPFEPVLGGYLVKDTQGEPLFVTGNPSKTQQQFYAYSVMSDHLQPIQTVQWDTVIIHGTNAFRTGGGRLLNVSIDLESGEISYDSGGVRAPFAFRFDDATLQAFNQMKTRATQIWGNNEKHCILGAQETGENRTHFFVFMYNKILQHWEHVAVEGIYSHIQLFERWMLIQQAFRSDERGVSDPIKITGQYTFYNLDTREHVVWQTVPHNEVLGIWGDTILYRIDDELFEATITQTGISHAQRIVQDPIIQDVHWAFIVP
ncbi:hypothetical protein U27_05160 [Candidatus Vecturithrix granuli]|uniref:Uncharacterized protein n=1 Tax=Vecturithrix granuli TaxID=1499967 RepID=A0A081C0T2_VECG1|nr:hypothetical protein U27_05160 [Candidatus Vecturithrix granuli]